MEARRREAGWLLWQSLSYLARALRPQMEPLLREIGLNSPLEAWVLQFLWAHGPTRLVDVARATHLPVSTLSDLTERLVSVGLVGRMPHPRDRRSVVFAATASAEQTLSRLHAGVAARMAGPLADMDSATLEQLTTGLRALTEALERAGGAIAPGAGCAARPDRGPGAESDVEG